MPLPRPHASSTSRSLALLAFGLVLASPGLAGGGEKEPDPGPAAAAQQADQPAPSDLRSTLLGGDGWIKLRLRYEDVDQDGADYGSEIDLLFTWPIADELAFGVKYADYSADDHASDTRKAWAWLEASF